MKKPAPTSAREKLARAIYPSLIGSPVFSEQLNEDPGDDRVTELGRATAIDAFDLAEAFQSVARGRS